VYVSIKTVGALECAWHFTKIWCAWIPKAWRLSKISIYTEG